jgi:hypothetical protein
MQRRRFTTPFHKLVGGPGHGRNHHGDLMTGVDLTLDMARDVADPLDIGHRGAAEFHDQSSHDENSNPLCWSRNEFCESADAKWRVYITMR